MKTDYQPFILGVFGGLVALILVLLSVSIFSIVQRTLMDINAFWSMISAFSTVGAFSAAVFAACCAYKTWNLEKLPVAHAIGAFIISTKTETNELRDRAIFDNHSPHTLQLVNVGRGPAKKVTPSVREDVAGKFLEEINPHSFSLPANKGTKEFGEVLRVHGQRFVSDDDYELEFEDDRKTGYFYIHFEDYKGKQYLTRVKIDRVGQANEELESLIETPGIEIWKVMDNITGEVRIKVEDHIERG